MPVQLSQIETATRMTEFNREMAKHGYTQFETCTCAKCPINGECELAFDLYNTDGDCLAEK